VWLDSASIDREILIFLLCGIGLSTASAATFMLVMVSHR
jgi:hypothetical protein